MFGDSTFIDELGGGESENDEDSGIERNPQDDGDHQLLPLLSNPTTSVLAATATSAAVAAAASSSAAPSADALEAASSPSGTPKNLFRSRKVSHRRGHRPKRGMLHPSRRNHLIPSPPSLPSTATSTAAVAQQQQQQLPPHTPRCNRNNRCSMNCVARVLVWLTVISLIAAIGWYSYELAKQRKEPHLIAWFSAGAFVLLGFPISMWGIISHLSNYNQPHVQVYVVRILWMVPLYSIESWLAMRFHKQGIYIETLRDLYESYVLYSFLQFLIQVLGGEQALILMLKDKSPTRGVHMWGFQWCMKPWLMGQPVRKTVYTTSTIHENELLLTSPLAATATTSTSGVGGGVGGNVSLTTMGQHPSRSRAVKRVHWTSPFFVACKFGVLQYVLLKFLCAVIVLVLEYCGLYKEGDFTYRGGYLYICIITNVSQCWALYCLIFFYYATKTELSPIRPVGKFLSVKALVFFTWWQSVFISVLYHMGMIRHYDVKDWTPEDVAKAIQDYLICLEMFLAAVVHTFVFPHTEYAPQAVEARRRALNQIPMIAKKRLGRQHQHQYHNKHYGYSSSVASRGPMWRGDDSSKCSSDGRELELSTFDANSVHTAETWDEVVPHRNTSPLPPSHHHHRPTGSFDSDLSPAAESWEEDVDDQIMHMPPRSEHEYNVNSSNCEGYYDSEDDLSLGIPEGEEEFEESAMGGADVDGNSTDEDDGDNHYSSGHRTSSAVAPRKKGFVSAFIDSTIPFDLQDNTVGIFKGDYRVERKTLLHHATTSDQYDLFSQSRRPFKSTSSNRSADMSPNNNSAEST